MHIIQCIQARLPRISGYIEQNSFEVMSNPDKFLYSTGTFSSKRKLTYFNQRLLDVDGRFARDLDYLFVAQYIVEAKQLLDDITLL